MSTNSAPAPSRAVVVSAWRNLWSKFFFSMPAHFSFPRRQTPACPTASKLLAPSGRGSPFGPTVAVEGLAGDAQLGTARRRGFPVDPSPLALARFNRPPTVRKRIGCGCPEP